MVSKISIKKLTTSRYKVVQIIILRNKIHLQIQNPLFKIKLNKKQPHLKYQIHHIMIIIIKKENLIGTSLIVDVSQATLAAVVPIEVVSHEGPGTTLSIRALLSQPLHFP